MLFGSDFQDGQIAYELGRSIVGMRAEDVLSCARYAAERFTGGRNDTVILAATGNIGIPAFHAAALEPALFHSVAIRQMIASWADLVHKRRNGPAIMGCLVHGSLQHYDLPNLEATLGKKLTIQQSTHDFGKPAVGGQ
jgi:hypothetical protein